MGTPGERKSLHTKPSKIKRRQQPEPPLDSGGPRALNHPQKKSGEEKKRPPPQLLDILVRLQKNRRKTLNKKKKKCFLVGQSGGGAVPEYEGKINTITQKTDKRQQKRDPRGNPQSNKRVINHVVPKRKKEATAEVRIEKRTCLDKPEVNRGGVTVKSINLPATAKQKDMSNVKRTGGKKHKR